LPEHVHDPDLPLARLFELWPGAARVFIRRGTGCFGCPIAPFHTVVDTCREYGFDEADLHADLEAALRNGNGPASGGGIDDIGN
jgi:hybrid cluster-associated redox disulfide protein